MQREQLLDSYRPEMDGLRGVACLIVLFGHSVRLYSSGSAELFQGIAKIGVWLFFALSAFLLTLRLTRREFSITLISDYVVARTLRIVPAFVVAVLIYYLLGGLGIGSWSTVWSILTFQSTVGHLWTIPAELGFYLFLPLVVFIASAVCERGSVWGTVALLAVAAVLLAIWWPPMIAPGNATNPLWYSTTFLSGVAAAFAARRWPSSGNSAVALVAILGIILAAILHKVSFAGLLFENIGKKHFIFGPIWALVVYLVYAGANRLGMVLAHPLLVKVGEASFSIYLLQAIPIVYSSGMPTPLRIPLVVVACIVIGRVSYLLVELPIYDLRSRLYRTPTDIGGDSTGPHMTPDTSLNHQR